jgi:hypothetical protein
VFEIVTASRTDLASLVKSSFKVDGFTRFPASLETRSKNVSLQSDSFVDSRFPDDEGINPFLIRQKA